VAPTDRRWPAALAVAVAAAVAIGIVGEFRSPLNGDAAYQLDVARRMLDGAGLYRDLIDLNPPFVFWMSLPVAALGLDGIGTITAYRACVLALAALSLLLAWPAVRGRPALWAGFLLMGLGLPLGYFGEREHLLVMLVFPLVAFVAVAAEGDVPGRTRSVTVGLLAAAGILLKPPAVMLLLVLAAARVRAGGTPRALLRTDLLAVAAGGTAGVMAVLLFAPGYLSMVRDYGALYREFARQPLGALLFRDVQMWAVWAALAGVIAGGHGLPVHHRVRVLLGASLTLFAAAVAQGKGFGYHYYPAMVFAVLTLLELAASPSLGAGGRPLVAKAVAGVALTPMLWLFGQVAWSRAEGRPTALAGEQARVAGLIGGQPGTRVAIVSARLADAYPVVLDHDYRHVLAFPHAWMATLPSATPEVGSLRRRYGQDLDRYEPEALVVRARGSAGPGDFAVDYITWLCADPAVRRALASYDLTSQVEGFDLYRRTTAGAGACASS
jgi:hypothetical protein